MDLPVDEQLVVAAARTIRASREDDRPHLPEPPPVALAAVQDVRLPMVAGLERALDEFYVGLLRFERTAGSGGGVTEGPAYRGENHSLVFHVTEVPEERKGCRPVGIVTPFFGEVIQALEEQNRDYELVRGLGPGSISLLIQDPAGNWVEISPWGEVR